MVRFLEGLGRTLTDRVRAHIFLCMLAYYVEWHMREAWLVLMFADTDQQAKTTRDPVAPAKRSKTGFQLLNLARQHSDHAGGVLALLPNEPVPHG